MVRLLRDVMGLRVEFEQATTMELSCSDGGGVQVFAPGDQYFEFFSQQARGPVALFEVEDVHVARNELIAAGVEVIGSNEQDSNWEWLHFRGPDGNLYELASRRPDAS
jgi:catechol 2,3-dioxygenase-like lactoylglutathione lyase family enzyme